MSIWTDKHKKHKMTGWKFQLKNYLVISSRLNVDRSDYFELQTRVVNTHHGVV